MTTTSWITNHWADKDWTTLQVHQRYTEGDHKGEFYREGPLGDRKTSEFLAMKHEETGDLFQNNSKWETWGKVAVASALFVPHVIATAVGNTRLVQMGVAAYQEGFGNVGAHAPSQKHVWAFLKNTGFLLGLYLVHRNDLILGDGIVGSVASLAKTAAICFGVFYTVYNPRGTAIWLNAAEEVVHKTPLAECQSLASNHWLSISNWKEILEGSIPLTSILNLHRVGNIKDKVDENPRFTPVEEPKKDK